MSQHQAELAQQKCRKHTAYQHSVRGESRGTWRWMMAIATLITSTSLMAIAPPAVFAQEEQFPPSPLEVDESDPLLPRLVVDRPLSPQERRVLSEALDELNAQGVAALADGNVEDAFAIWVRELRLRRALGPYEEVAALKRVGSVAWSESQTTEVRAITERLLEIETETQASEPVDYELLLTIAEAYQSMRSRRPAVALYDKILLNARQNQDTAIEEKALIALGDLHLSWFDYPNAAIAYNDLLTLVRQQGDKDAELNALNQLAHIYTQDENHAEAIATRQELIDLYESRQEFNQIPALKIANGDDYISLDRPELAAPSYQEAFAVARGVQYFGYAADALKKLANLYLSLERADDALVVYNLLVDVEQQSFNYYGLMNAYAWIGQLHQQRGASNQALVAYRQGLDLAEQLSYRVDYFQQQVQQLSSQ